MADLQMYADHFLNEMIEEAVLGIAYEAHRSLTRGTLFLDENQSDDEEKYKIVTEKGLDIFGQPLCGSKKNVECLCPNCKRNMAASRFAPHLEKCMGMGRNSSRIASQRIANSGKFSTVSDVLGPEEDPDDSNDADWFVACESSSTRKTKKRKAERSNGSPRTSKAIIGRSKTSGNSPKLLSGDVHDLNDNVNILPAGTRHQLESNIAQNENIHQTMSLWQQHISATLSEPEGARITQTAVPPTGGIIKKSKKGVKHSHSKKNKKRQLPAHQSLGLS
uniref:SAGA-associated factor 11 homolog n=1 Tax=Phallusia mammillata TaxID=59560 RepID=A0A6F9D7H0_9ASCI|nr:SAGA-associated factor 11 homolog [Phallusia mammillata]